MNSALNRDLLCRRRPCSPHQGRAPTGCAPRRS
jgi:hypothetical protein